MGFVNLPVDPDQLPTTATLVLEPMAPAYAREVRAEHLIIWLCVSVALTVPAIIVAKPAALKLALAALPLAGIFLGALFTWIAIKAAHAKAMALRDLDIVFRSGLIFRKLVVLPFNRIQHVEVSSGPLQRRFGLASLKFYTAGGAGIDLKIDGLEQDRAHQLREFIMQRAGHGN